MSGKTYSGKTVAAGSHTVKARSRDAAWRKIHRLIARDVLNGDTSQISILPGDYRVRLAAIERRGGLRLRLARKGLLLP